MESLREAPSLIDRDRSSDTEGFALMVGWLVCLSVCLSAPGPGAESDRNEKQAE